MKKLREYKALGCHFTLYDEGIEIHSWSKNRFMKKDQIVDVSVKKFTSTVTFRIDGTKEVITLSFSLKDIGSKEFIRVGEYLQGKHDDSYISSVVENTNSTLKVDLADVSKIESKPNSKSTNKTYLWVIGTIVGIGFLFSLFSDSNPSTSTTPAIQLAILEPVNEISLESSTTTIKGTVQPVSSKVTVNSSPASVDENGNFSKEVSLTEENNSFTIAAFKGTGGKSVTETISIKRIFSPEEVLERAEAEAKLRAKIEKERAMAEEKEKAELDAYNNSKAGKLCAEYPNWSKQECQLVADRKIWIGMTREMLVEMRGLPNHANPSNYGGVTEWQWCWNDFTPSCFYDRDGDGVVDSYN